MTRSCADCLHGRGHYGSLRCLRAVVNPTRNDIAGAPYCDDERRGGLLAWFAGACGKRGQHFRRRAPVGMVSVSPVEGRTCGYIGAAVIGAGDCWACSACGSEHIREART